MALAATGQALVKRLEAFASSHPEAAERAGRLVGDAESGRISEDAFIRAANEQFGIEYGGDANAALERRALAIAGVSPARRLTTTELALESRLLAALPHRSDTERRGPIITGLSPFAAQISRDHNQRGAA